MNGVHGHGWGASLSGAGCLSKGAWQPFRHRGACRPSSSSSDDRDEAYGLVRRTLVRLDYDALGRAGKGTAREFLGKATGLSRAQVTRLIGQYRATGRVEHRRAANSGRSFGAPTTTPWSRARTPAWCASGSATTTSRSASRPK